MVVHIFMSQHAPLTTTLPIQSPNPLFLDEVSIAVKPSAADEAGPLIVILDDGLLLPAVRWWCW